MGIIIYIFYMYKLCTVCTIYIYIIWRYRYIFLCIKFIEPCLSLSNSLTNSLNNVFFCFPYIIQNKGTMINMFTYDMFSVCHSLGQFVMGIALFIFGLIPQEYSLRRKFYKNICMLMCSRMICV